MIEHLCYNIVILSEVFVMYNNLSAYFDSVDALILSDYFDHYPIKDSTKKDYAREIYNFINFIGKAFNKANIEDCRRYITYLSEKKKFKSSTIDRIYSTLYAIFEFTLQNKDKYNLTNFENCFTRIRRPEVPRDVEISDIIKSHELDRIIAYLKNGPIREYALFSLIFTAALTAQEVSNLTWEQFIEDGNSNIAIEFLLPKGRKRYVFVPEDTWKLLIEFRKTNSKPDASYVFFSRKNAKLSSTQIRRLFKQICMAAGLENTSYSISHLKNTAIAYSLSHNMDNNSLRQQLGCSDLRPTRRYDKVIANLNNSTGNFLKFD